MKDDVSSFLGEIFNSCEDDCNLSESMESGMDDKTILDIEDMFERVAYFDKEEFDSFEDLQPQMYRSRKEIIDEVHKKYGAMSYSTRKLDIERRAQSRIHEIERAKFLRGQV